MILIWVQFLFNLMKTFLVIFTDESWIIMTKTSHWIFSQKLRNHVFLQSNSYIFRIWNYIFHCLYYLWSKCCWCILMSFFHELLQDSYSKSVLNVFKIVILKISNLKLLLFVAFLYTILLKTNSNCIFIGSTMDVGKYNVYNVYYKYVDGNFFCDR